MRRIGLQNVRLEETPGHPVVYGEWLGAAGAPTILFYGHYDVQPVDPLNLWTSPPFEATIRDGEIYARGSADDKGQVFMHFKAVEAHMKQNGRLPVNMKFLIEGEEEVGSANLDNFINAPQGSAEGRRRRHQRLADVRSRHPVDLLRPARPRPTSRSICAARKSDLHSGSFGGAVANPAMVLAQVLAQMKDKSGRIKIRRLLRRCGARCRPEERAELAKLPFNEKKYRQELGAPKLFGETGYTTLERIVGAADVRSERPAVRLHRRRRQDRAAGRGDGQGQHAPGAEPGPEEDRRSVRGVREEGDAEDGGAEDHAHARRQAVDDGVRQSVRAGGRPRHRAGLRPAPGVQPRRRIDPGGRRRSRRSSACRACCSASACPTRTRTRPTRSSISATSTTASSRRRSSTERSAR